MCVAFDMQTDGTLRIVMCLGSLPKSHDIIKTENEVRLMVANCGVVVLLSAALFELLVLNGSCCDHESYV